MHVDIPKDTWPGTVKISQIGATASEGGTRKSVVRVGGEKSIPFMHFESAYLYPPVVAVEIKDQRPEDWSPILLKTWGDVVNDPGRVG